MESVSLIALDFKTLEKDIYESSCKAAREIMKEILEKTDRKLADERDKKRYRHKGAKRTSIRTVMGVVEYDRNIYQDKMAEESGTIKHIYLLDKLLGQCSIGKMSVNLVERAVEHSADESFRKSAKILNTYTSQSVSHQAVWNVVQVAGKRMALSEAHKIEEFRLEDSIKGRICPILFEEADGMHISIQKRKGSKKRCANKELKIGIAYEGWAPRHPSSTHYKTVGKLAYAGFMDATDFQKLRKIKVGSVYNLDEVGVRVLNGDGAKWISHGLDEENELFQLDPFHIGQAVCRGVRDKKKRSYILGCIKANKVAEALTCLEELKYECGGLKKEVICLETLQNYLKNNRRGLQSYRDRIHMANYTPPQGLTYRKLGTMERNVELFDRRMDGPLSWSIQGANHMAKILAHKISGTLPEALTGIWEASSTRKFNRTEEIAVKNTKKKKLKKAYSDSHGSWKVQQGSFPFGDSSLSPGRRIIRNLLNCRDLCDIGFQ